MKRSIVALIALAITASCSDSPTEPQLAAAGSLAFGYNGGTLVAAGTYSASGGLPTSEAEQSTRAWAAAVRDAQNANNIGVISSSPRANNRADLVILSFDRSTAGSSTIDMDSCTEDDCAGMVFWYNLSQSQSSAGEVLCGLETGTMTIATLTATRVTGTFSGTGSCTSLDDFMTFTAFTVTNGTFDAPVLPDIPGSNLMVRSR